jgi:hypothetical protein
VPCQYFVHRQATNLRLDSAGGGAEVLDVSEKQLVFVCLAATLQLARRGKWSRPEDLVAAALAMALSPQRVGTGTGTRTRRRLAQARDRTTVLPTVPSSKLGEM